MFGGATVAWPVGARARQGAIPVIGFLNGQSLASLNRPGGNVTGASVFTAQLEAKRLELLHELAPAATPIGALVDPGFSGAAPQAQALETAARAMGRELRIVPLGSDVQLATAFAALAAARAGAMVVTGNPLYVRLRDGLIPRAKHQAMPAIFKLRGFPAAGGLMSYGPSLDEVFRQIGAYTGRILRGEKPADLPVLQPTKFEFVINPKTARALDLTIPSTSLARADEEIE